MNWLPSGMRRKREFTPTQRVNPSNGRTGKPEHSVPANIPPRRVWPVFLVILIINYLIMRSLFPGPDAPIMVPYTTFRDEVEKGNVSEIYSRGTSIEGRFVAAVTWPPPEQKAEQKNIRSRLPRQPNVQSQTADTFTTELPAFVDPELEAFLIDNKVEISAVPIQGSPWATFLFGFGPAILIIAFYMWLYRRAAQMGGGAGGILGMGKSKARRYDQAAETKVTFNDVAGIDEAKNELVEIVTDRDRRFQRAGANTESDPYRDGWFLRTGRHHRAGGNQSARCS